METISLDCPPGYPRPGDLIGAVVEGTGLSVPETSIRLFGNWIWEFDVPREEWVSRIQPIIKPRIEAFYHNGFIRYGDW